MKNAHHFHCQPESVAGARRFVRDLLSDQPPETVEAAELMTSELATNSVRHAQSDFELAIHRSRDEIRVEVSDYGQGQPVPRSPTAREQSGRGLQIVQELAEEWGIAPLPNGKLVWFTLPLRTDASERKSSLTASSEKAPGRGREACCQDGVTSARPRSSCAYVMARPLRPSPRAPIANSQLACSAAFRPASCE